MPHAFKTAPPAGPVDDSVPPPPSELVLTIAVPAYNEDAFDLKRTLISLHEQMPDLDLLGLRVHILGNTRL